MSSFQNISASSPTPSVRFKISTCPVTRHAHAHARTHTRTRIRAKYVAHGAVRRPGGVGGVRAVTAVPWRKRAATRRVRSRWRACGHGSASPPAAGTWSLGTPSDHQIPTPGHRCACVVCRVRRWVRVRHGVCEHKRCVCAHVQTAIKGEGAWRTCGRMAHEAQVAQVDAAGVEGRGEELRAVEGHIPPVHLARKVGHQHLRTTTFATPPALWCYHACGAVCACGMWPCALWVRVRTVLR